VLVSFLFQHSSARPSSEPRGRQATQRVSGLAASCAALVIPRGRQATQRVSGLAASCAALVIVGCAPVMPPSEPNAVAPPPAAPVRAAPPPAAQSGRLTDTPWHAPDRDASGTASLAALDGALWLASGSSPSGRWHLGYRFDGAQYRTSGYPTWDESGRVTLLETDGHRLHLRFAARIYDGKADEPVERWLEWVGSGDAFIMGGLRFVKQPAEATVASGPVAAGRERGLPQVPSAQSNDDLGRRGMSP